MIIIFEFACNRDCWVNKLGSSGRMWLSYTLYTDFLRFRVIRDIMVTVILINELWLEGEIKSLQEFKSKCAFSKK